MKIRFTKMHGLGNDFIVLDGIHQSLELQPSQIAAMAKRDTGIGFDQCLLIESSPHKGIDFIYRIFNANGQEVGQCGNGARCLALFIQHYGLSPKKHLKIATKTTTMELRIHEDNTVSVDLGIPKLAPKDIPLLVESQSILYTLPLNEEEVVKLHAVNVGNPHAVLVVPDVSAVPVSTLGRQISSHKQFPEQTNAGFMQILKSDHLQLRVYERGCGETQACGSGGVAAAAIGRLYYDMAENIRVTLLGGDLIVTWPKPYEPIVLTGPATFVYEGIFWA